MKTRTLHYTHITYIALVAMLFYMVPAMAQNASLTVTADRNSAQVGEQITITAVLESNKNIPSVSAPQIPPNDMFDVSGTNQQQSSSTSISAVNGKITQTTTVSHMFFYGIVPKKTGTIHFPALHINAGNVNCSSQPFTITVGKQQGQNQSGAQQGAPEVHIVLSLNKRNLVVGEQAIATVQISYKAQAQIQLSNGAVNKMIQDCQTSLGSEFTVVQLFNQLHMESKVINGENRAVMLLQWAVYPVRSGTISVKPVRMEYAALRRIQQARGSNDPFAAFMNDPFFSGGQVEQVVRAAVSNGISVSVAALPNPPANFSGAVGSFKLSSDLSPKKVPAGESATLTLTLSGTTRAGNIGDIALPQLPDCSVFDPEQHISADTSANGISSRKVLKYLIVPKHEGTVSIPPVSWSYYDPAAHRYVTLRTDSLVLTVTKGTGKQSVIAATAQEDIQQLGNDIRYIKTGIKVKQQSLKPYTNPVLILLYLIALCIAVFSLLYKLQMRNYRDNAGLMLRQKAMRTALKDIRKLEKTSADLSMDAFTGKIIDCIERFILHKFGFSAIGKVLADLKQELIAHGVNEEAAENLVSFMETMDTCRFGCAGLDVSEKNVMLQKTLALVNELSKTKKGKQS